MNSKHELRMPTADVACALVTQLGGVSVQGYLGRPHTAQDVAEGVVLGSAKQLGQGVRHGPQETQRQLSHG